MYYGWLAYAGNYVRIYNAHFKKTRFVLLLVNFNLAMGSYFNNLANDLMHASYSPRIQSEAIYTRAKIYAYIRTKNQDSR